MKNILILSALLAVVCATPAVVSTSAQAQQLQAGSHHAMPLILVRFNQPRVYFQRPMSNVVQRALNISPDVGFKVVHYTPKAGNKKAERDLNSVLQHLYRLGVRKGNVQVDQQVASALGHSEVHLYVR